MNTQKFLNNGQNRFPLSTDTLDFMQNQTLLLQGLTQALGDNYIITPPTTTTEGLIVINGELLPFRFGSGNESRFIAVYTETSAIDANGLLFPDVRTKRYALGVSTEQGAECYARAIFFHVHKQTLVQNARPAANIQIHQNLMTYPTTGAQALNVRIEYGGIFHISGFFKPNITQTNIAGDWRIGTLPTGFPHPKFPIAIPTTGVGFYDTSLGIKRPYNLHITTGGEVRLFMDKNSLQDWVWVNARIDMLRYF